MNKLSTKDIAVALNIAPSTVSRALNNKGRISEKTKEKIMNYIKQNDPDSSFIQEKKRTKTIGLVIAKLNNEFFAKIVEQFQKYLAIKNYLLVLTYSHYSYDVERQSILSLVDNHVDCIVALATRHATVSRDELKGIPIITIDESNPLIDDVPDYRIVSDQYVGGILATEELVQKGCRKIAYFTNIARYQNDLKFKGYCDTLKKYNIPYDNNLYITSGVRSDNSIEDAKMMVEYLLAKNIEFDGVFATSDRRALGIITALEKNGISCPEQVKVVGYDASSLAQSFNITSVSQDIEIIAQNCFYIILKIMGEDENHQIKSPIPVFLVRGTTT